jgi:hypothetical protein
VSDPAAQQNPADRPKEPRLTPEQIAQLPRAERDRYERYIAAKASARQQGVGTASAHHASPLASDQSSRSSSRTQEVEQVRHTSEQSRRAGSREKVQEKKSRIRLEDLTPDQVERLQKARKVKRREAARAAKEALGQGSSGLSADEKAELSGRRFGAMCGTTK